MKKVFLILSIIFVFSGCAFFGEKKTKIIFENNENELSEESKEKKEVVLEENAKVENEEKEIDFQEKLPDSKDSEKENEISKEVSLKKNDLSKELVSNSEIIDKLVSWGFSKKEARKIDTIIIHSSYNAVGSDEHNLEDIIYKEYKPYGVSPHYIISREGKIYRLVKDDDIAYHAGTSKMSDGRTGVNDFSIGVEIVNTKSEKPNNDQYFAIKKLIEYLKGKYEIKYVLGHSDIAPGRKDDPWNFDWEKIK